MFYVLQRTIHSACSDSFYVAKLQLESIIQNKMQLSCLVFFLFVCFFKTWTVFLLLLNVYLCNLAVPCGILSVLRIFDLLLYLEKEGTKKWICCCCFLKERDQMLFWTLHLLLFKCQAVSLSLSQLTRRICFHRT